MEKIIQIRNKPWLNIYSCGIIESWYWNLKEFEFFYKTETEKPMNRETISNK